jgi:hypothetical protein
MIVFLQLTTAGIDSGPFDLYSNFDYDVPFETGVSRDSLIAGYSTTVPDNAIIVRITSIEDCISSVDITLRDVECNLEGYTGEITTTSTSTSSTTTTTTTLLISYQYNADAYTCVGCNSTIYGIGFTNAELLTVGKWYYLPNPSLPSDTYKILITTYQGPQYGGANVVLYDIDKKDTCAELTCGV